jgi:RNA recognition motif-containing protein
MRIRIDNLASDVTEDDLRQLFEIFGRVAAVDTRRQGQATVDMPATAAAKEAITQLNGQTLRGFDIAVMELTDNRPSRRGSKPRRRKRR